MGAMVCWEEGFMWGQQLERMYAHFLTQVSVAGEYQIVMVGEPAPPPVVDAKGFD